METIIPQVSEILRNHLAQVSSALVATTLALYGGHVNEVVKKAMKNFHFLARLCVFVALCAFGYGLISVLAARAVSAALWRLGDLWLAPAIAASFLVVGLLAERKRKM